MTTIMTVMVALLLADAPAGAHDCNAYAFRAGKCSLAEYQAYMDKLVGATTHGNSTWGPANSGSHDPKCHREARCADSNNCSLPPLPPGCPQ